MYYESTRMFWEVTYKNSQGQKDVVIANTQNELNICQDRYCNRNDITTTVKRRRR